MGFLYQSQKYRLKQEEITEGTMEDVARSTLLPPRVRQAQRDSLEERWIEGSTTAASQASTSSQRRSSAARFPVELPTG